MLCIGHRGAAGVEPENTLRSVRRALELGADGVEIDVHLLDGELIVIHDGTLDRTTNGKGRLGRKSLAEVRTLDAGLGERVPLLREVLDAVAGRALVNIELKGAGTGGPVLEVVREYVARGWKMEDFLVSSFRRKELREFRGTGMRIGVLFAGSGRGFRPVARALDAWSIHLPLKYFKPGIVKRAHADGRRVFVFTVNTREDWERLERAGVDGAFSDFPGKAGIAD